MNKKSAPSAEFAAKMATEIAVAYLNRNSIERSELPLLITDIRRALAAPLFGEELGQAVEAPAAAQVDHRDEGVAAVEEGAAPRSAPAPINIEPAVDPKHSVTDEYLVCLEDGGRFRSLRRHLMAKYGLTPDQYREKWNLPSDYPMVAPSYARNRSQVAKRIGLGRIPAKPATQTNRRRGG